MEGNSFILTQLDDRGDAGRVAWVIFNDPDRRNALGLAGKEQSIAALAALRHDTSLRAGADGCRSPRLRERDRSG